MRATLIIYYAETKQNVLLIIKLVLQEEVQPCFNSEHVVLRVGVAIRYESVQVC